MQLNAPNVESQWLTVLPVGTPEMPFDKRFLESIRDEGSKKAAWDWLPRMSGGGSSFESYFERMMKLTEQGRFFPMTAYTKPEHVNIGGAAFLRASRTHRSVEIGFVWLHKGFRDWVSFAALQEAMIRRAQAWRAQRIFWNVSPRNDRMMRALERLGAREEGILRSAYRMNDGTWSDMAVYSLVKEDIAASLQTIGEQLKDAF